MPRMIYQRWVLTRCNGSPAEAITRIENATALPVDHTVLHQALKKPIALPVRLAQLVCVASEGECTLVELLDVDLIRKQYMYERPLMRVRAIEFQLAKCAKDLERYRGEIARLEALIAQVDAEVAELHSERLELVAGRAA